MEDLRDLTQTEQLVQSANIIKEKSLSLLQSRNMGEEFIDKQIEINKCVDEYVAGLGNIDNVSTEKFYGYLVKMCAMFHNAHLSVRYKGESEKRKYLSQHLLHINNKVYAICDGKLLEVVKIGGKPVNEVCKAMSEYICYETSEWLSVQLCNYLNRTTLYDILGIDYSSIELKNGQKLKVDITQEWFDFKKCFPPYDLPNEKPYSYSVIEPNFIKINYLTCDANFKSKIENFFEEVENIIETKNIKHYIFDVRGNPGGDSEIIKPLLRYLNENNITGVTLTDNRVFSSGTWAVRYAKTILNTTLIGQPLGQGNIRFGQSSGKIELSDDLIVSYTEKLFDFSDVFKTPGAIKPDIEVPLTAKDIENKTDKTLTVAIDYINKNFDIEKEKN